MILIVARAAKRVGTSARLGSSEAEGPIEAWRWCSGPGTRECRSSVGTVEVPRARSNIDNIIAHWDKSYFRDLIPNLIPKTTETPPLHPMSCQARGGDRVVLRGQ